MAWDNDKAIPEDAAIKAAHPLRSGRHDLYQEAMRMVGAKHSKGALVEMVTWLLLRIEQAASAALGEALSSQQDWEHRAREAEALWARVSDLAKRSGESVPYAVPYASYVAMHDRHDRLRSAAQRLLDALDGVAWQSCTEEWMLAHGMLIDALSTGEEAT